MLEKYQKKREREREREKKRLENCKMVRTFVLISSVDLTSRVNLSRAVCLDALSG